MDQQAQVVARMRIVAMGRIGRRGAAQREGREFQIRAGRDGEAAAQGDGLPAETAVPVLEHVEQRKAGGKVLVDHLGAPDLMGAAFAQAEQAGGVVDLAVQQDDGADAGVTQGPRRLQRGEAGQLGADVGRGVAQDPVHPVVGQGDGRLGTGLGPEGALAEAVAIDAIAVPLGKATAGGGAENLDMHGKG